MIMDINNTPHFVEVIGAGQPIIFLHGLYMDHRIWGNQIEKFSKEYQVILYDQRGHGNTKKGNVRVTFDQLADDLRMLIQQLKLKSPVLVGYSTAGAIVLNAISRYPEIAKAAVVTGAFSDMRGTYLHVNQKVGLFSTRYHLKRVTALLLALNHATSLSQFKTFVESVLQSDQIAVQEILEDMNQFDIREQLKLIQCPLLLLYGSKEHGNYRSELLDIVSHVPSAELHFIQGIRHATMTKKADQFYSVVKKFLENIDDST